MFHSSNEIMMRFVLFCERGDRVGDRDDASMNRAMSTAEARNSCASPSCSW